MKKSTLISSLAIALLLVGCGTKEPASVKQFKNIASDYNLDFIETSPDFFGVTQDEYDA